MSESRQRAKRIAQLRIDQLSEGEADRLREIRLRALQDAPEAFETTFEQASGWPPERWTRQLRELATFVAVESDGDVGMVRAALHDEFRDAGYLISMWVAPEARRQGIGSALVDAVILWAKGQRCTRLFLEVAESNSPAMALYIHKGFAPNGVVGAMSPPREHIREIQLVMELGFSDSE